MVANYVADDNFYYNDITDSCYSPRFSSQNTSKLFIYQQAIYSLILSLYTRIRKWSFGKFSKDWMTKIIWQRLYDKDYKQRLYDNLTKLCWISSFFISINAFFFTFKKCIAGIHYCFLLILFAIALCKLILVHDNQNVNETGKLT